MPTAGSRLLPLVVANFPHKLRDRNTQCLFLRAVYALAEGRGGAGIREGLLTGATEHLISIDVEIRWAAAAVLPVACGCGFRVPAESVVVCASQAAKVCCSCLLY